MCRIASSASPASARRRGPRGSRNRASRCGGERMRSRCLPIRGPRRGVMPGRRPVPAAQSDRRSRRFDRSAGASRRAILRRTRRSGRSAPRPSGLRAGGSERRHDRLHGRKRRRKRARGPSRSPFGMAGVPPDGWSRVQRSRIAGALVGRSAALRARRSFATVGLSLGVSDARSGTASSEIDRTGPRRLLVPEPFRRLRRRQERSAPERVARIPPRGLCAPDASLLITQDSRPQPHFVAHAASTSISGAGVGSHGRHEVGAEPPKRRQTHPPSRRGHRHPDVRGALRFLRRRPPLLDLVGRAVEAAAMELLVDDADEQ